MDSFFFSWSYVEPNNEALRNNEKELLLSQVIFQFSFVHCYMGQVATLHHSMPFTVYTVVKQRDNISQYL